MSAYREASERKAEGSSELRFVPRQHQGFRVSNLTVFIVFAVDDRRSHGWTPLDERPD